MGDVKTLIQACAYGIRATSPAHFPHSPAEMASGHDMLLQQRVVTDWENIKEKRRAQAEKNNSKENKGRVQHEYKVGDLVLLVTPAYERKNQVKISSPTAGPYRITKVYNNGTIRILRGAYEDKVSIRRVRPYTKR